MGFDDLVQQVYCHFIEEDKNGITFFQKFDDTVTSFGYFVQRASKNYLITLSRKRRVSVVSANHLVNDEEMTELQDFFAAPDLEDERDRLEMLETIRDMMPDWRISPAYFLTYRMIFHQYFIEEKTFRDIGQGVGITANRVSGIFSEMREDMFECWKEATIG